MIQPIVNSIRTKMNEVLEKLQDEFKNIRTGKASTAIVENLMVSYYGTQTPLKQMASLTTPDANSILISPWDQNALGDIENCIRNSDLNLNPVNDGRNVRIVLPPLTEERRKELAKMVGKISEEGRIILRNLRQEAWDQIKKLEKDGKITEDDRYTGEDQLNKMIDEFNKKIEELSEKKEEELMRV
ncbi:ribosome recycling factor [Candidatus Berkelbacteria bacterium RIFCSPHIGHO2_12_FULL_36_9]|uniref:Ribosome-recycling factor n=1 Tax=Candidatus Berkelbacteria bacterium RIFCSPHIGHO2_12_FULL_36_9 TaxID=1797469 RepID=A0A1F5EGS5_9BACT|nr:MAG: ribosome recycling factor [Candidatus Berkelbacteria bacterium RIFCSPHIGHO2_12_FULL_36_9]